MNQRDLSLPGPHDERQSRDEIAAEIADHLASSAAELTKGGAAAEEAHTAARKKFGDVAQITKACYWIQNGETIMLRWTLVSLAAVLCILLGLSVLGNWRSQSQLADEMGKLSAELKALAAAKQTPPPVPQPPEITGVIYTGSKDKPLANAKVAILRADGTVARRINCDEKGQYQSGPLEPGDYCVTAPIQEAPAIYSDLITQSRPIFLHSTAGKVLLDLDAAYHAGGLKLRISRNLPTARKDGSHLIVSHLSVFLIRSRQREYPWTPKENNPSNWPVFCKPVFPINTSQQSFSGRGVPIDGMSIVSSYVDLKQGEETEFHGYYGSNIAAILPPDNTEIEATLFLDIVPLDERGEIVLPVEAYQKVQQLIPELPNLSLAEITAGKNRTISTTLLDKLAGYRWPFSPGQLWRSKIKGVFSEDPIWSQVKASPRQSALVKDRQFTKIVIDIPEGIEDELQKVIDSAPDANEFDKLLREGLLRRQLAFKVTGYEPTAK